MRRYVLRWLFLNMSICIHICPCIVDIIVVTWIKLNTVEVRNLWLADHHHPHIPLLSPGLVSTASTQATKFGQPAGASGPPKWLFNNSNCACSFCWTWQFLKKQMRKIAKKATNKKVSEILNCQKEHQFCYLLFLGGLSHCRWIGITFNVAILSSNLRYSPAIFEHLQHSKSWNR